MGRARQKYHHGDLRRTLMDAAVRRIEAEGFDGFTMAEAAREAGVSSGAPYRHFADRDALLDAIAEEGAELLDAEVEARLAEAGSDTWSQLVAMGQAHVAFAWGHPAHARVMHRPEGLDPDDDEARAEVEASTHTWRAAGRHRDAALRLAAQAAVYGLVRMIVDRHVAGLTRDEALAAVPAVFGALRP
jgi:AcrR family transcriptional regulator